MTKNHLNNIFIIGFMASGKSTLGKKLSKHLNYSFIDTDKVIEKELGKTIPQIFKDSGEQAFRDYEENTLAELVKSTNNKVISTGGGLPCNQKNLDLMLKNGVVIFLELDLKSILNRFKASKTKRPLLANLSEIELTEKTNTLYQQRENYYKQAHITINALNIRSVDLNEISNKLHSFSK
jgi:shikimate kinase